MSNVQSVEQVTRRVIDNLVDQGFMFTALDVSNAVKDHLPGVRHREVSPIVRSLFEDAAMGDDYTRTEISVTAGARQVSAFLYHSEDDEAQDYDGNLRQQQARPPSARRGPTSGSTSATAPGSAPAAPPAPAAHDPFAGATVATVALQRDGSLCIPRDFVERAGIYDDVLHLDAAGVGSGLVLSGPIRTHPLAELELDDDVTVPASSLRAFKQGAPITVRHGVRVIEIDGQLANSS